jgi:hypothetical protein
MAFRGVLEDGYVDISVPDTISLQPDHTLKITGEIMHSADNLANDMHERNVGELQHRIEQGEYPEKPMDLEETA